MAVKKKAAYAATITEEEAAGAAGAEAAEEAAPGAAEQEENMAKATAAETVRLIYVGPSLPHGMLKCNTVLVGTEEEILASVSGAVQEYPEARRLLVPTDKAAAIKAKIKAPGNLYNNYSKTIQGLIAQKGGKR